MVWVPASGDFDNSVAFTASTTEIFFTNPPNTLEFTCLWPSLEEQDEKEFINELHVEEHRKDLFRVASIIPNSHNFKQKITSHNIPSSRNMRGNQSRRV